MTPSVSYADPKIANCFQTSFLNTFESTLTCGLHSNATTWLTFSLVCCDRTSLPKSANRDQARNWLELVAQQQFAEFHLLTSAS